MKYKIEKSTVPEGGIALGGCTNPCGRDYTGLHKNI